MALDIRDYKKEFQQVGGVNIDASMESQKDELYVEALDSFQLIKNIHHIFVADLNTLVAPMRRQISIAIEDNYQFDLLYYGLIMKYWPLLSPMPLNYWYNLPYKWKNSILLFLHP